MFNLNKFTKNLTFLPVIWKIAVVQSDILGYVDTVLAIVRYSDHFQW